MEIIFIIIFIICAIITFKTKDTRFPNNPYLGWIVCMIGIAVGLYLLYSAMNGAAGNAAFNAGYRDALNDF